MIIAKEGKISEALIRATPNVPSPQTYRARFGSLVNAYRLSGYKATWGVGNVTEFFPKVLPPPL
jgi:hypothetical protein